MPRKYKPQTQKAIDQKKRAVGIRPFGRQAKIITAKYLISIAL
jgi:hypothetical protein